MKNPLVVWLNACGKPLATLWQRVLDKAKPLGILGLSVPNNFARRVWTQPTPILLMICKIRRPHFENCSPMRLAFWEPHRIPYNLILIAIVFTWLVATWPHFRPALTLTSLGIFTVLGLIANVCYSAAYLIDIALQTAAFRSARRRWRWVLWLAGLIFAIVLTCKLLDR